MVLCPLQQPVAVAPGALRSYLQAIRHKLVSPGRTVLRVRCHFVAMPGEVSRLPRGPGRALRLRRSLPVAVASPSRGLSGNPLNGHSPTLALAP
jgi:hypothetical protein